jgi:hypothetical protein
MFFLPINLEQNEEGRGHLALGLRAFINIFSLVLICWCSLSTAVKAQGADLVRIRFSPDITQETKDRLQSMELDSSPFTKPDARYLGIHDLDAFISEDDLARAQEIIQARGWDPGSPARVLLTIGLSRVLSMQVRAADWHTEFRPERIEYVRRDLEHRVDQEMSADRIKGRRIYLLRQLNKELRLPFQLEKLFNEAGLLQVKQLHREFDRVKKILAAQGLPVESEFQEYLKVLLEKWNSFAEQNVDGFEIDWSGYRPLEKEAPLTILFSPNPNLTTERQLSVALLQLIESLDRSLRRFTQTTPIGAFENLYGFFLMNPEPTVNLNEPIEANRNISSKLGFTSVPPQALKTTPQTAPINDEELTRLIFDTFNAAYLEEVFLRELEDWGFRNSRDYQKSRLSLQPHRREIENFYAQRTDGQTPDQRYQREFELKLIKFSFLLDQKFERSKANVYFRDAHKSLFRHIAESLGRAYHEEAVAAGFRDSQEAAGRGFLFPQSKASLKDLRRSALENLAEEMKPHLSSLKMDRQEFVISGTWENIREQARLLLNENSDRVLSSLEAFRKSELSGGSRQLINIDNELVELAEGPQLSLWGFLSARVLKHDSLFDPQNYLYGQIEDELRNQRSDQAYLELFEDFLRPQLQYMAPPSTRMRQNYDSLKDIFAEIKSTELAQIIRHAAQIEHQRMMASGHFGRTTFFRRAVR